MGWGLLPQGLRGQEGGEVGRIIGALLPLAPATALVAFPVWAWQTPETDARGFLATTGLLCCDSAPWCPLVL